MNIKKINFTQYVIEKLFILICKFIILNIILQLYIYIIFIIYLIYRFMTNIYTLKKYVMFIIANINTKITLLLY